MAVSGIARADNPPGRTCFHPLERPATPPSWQDLATKVRTTYGRLDLLVNNAGVSTRATSCRPRTTTGTSILRTNLWAPWAGIRTFIEDLTTSPRASVVNIGSIIRPPPTPATPRTPRPPRSPTRSARPACTC
ncbi:hypothetical protein GCM10020220_095140 [Nonomuraea rubra]|uniref:SDR family NAD(P)-dependent oxidoreductase n=1 Tax=Nonomuraea rubra TaxID=46180 RepID=UPI003372C1CF